MPSTASLVPAVPAVRATATVAGAHHLRVHTSGEPDVLVRVLCALRRRGGTIVSVDYAGADRHAPERFRVGVLAPRRSAGQLAAWLRNLIGVLEVGVE